jgi:hypothetical protein
VYDGTHWTTLNMPGTWDMWLQGISGSTIIGRYWDTPGQRMRGCLYDGGSWAGIDYPGAVDTYPQGISGNNIVGYYTDSAGKYHGFLLAVPEPASVVLLAVGGLLVGGRRGRTRERRRGDAGSAQDANRGR